MKFITLQFKFFDCDNSTAKMIQLECYQKDVKDEWVDTGNMEQYVEYVADRARFSHELKRQGAKYIQEHYVKGSGESISTMFEGYRLASIKVTKDAKIKNLNKKEGIGCMRCVESHCKKVFKFFKGGKPNERSDISTFTTEYHDDHFKIVFESDKNFTLQPLGNIKAEIEGDQDRKGPCAQMSQMPQLNESKQLNEPSIQPIESAPLTQNQTQKGGRRMKGGQRKEYTEEQYRKKFEKYRYKTEKLKRRLGMQD
jgi:hypothetical protein